MAKIHTVRSGGERLKNTAHRAPRTFSPINFPPCHPPQLCCMIWAEQEEPMTIPASLEQALAMLGVKPAPQPATRPPGQPNDWRGVWYRNDAEVPF